MMPKNKLEQEKREIRFLRRTIFVLLVLIGLLGIAFLRIPSQITIYTAPDVSKAFTQKNGEIPLHSVHSFARVMWETINYCEEDCGTEFEPTLDKYKAYLTKSCRQDLLSHFKRSGDIYKYRSRLLLPAEDSIYSPNKIKQISPDMWFVKLTYNLKDDVGTVVTRDSIMQYPLKIVRSDKPAAINPMGLEVDCYFGQGPVMLEQKGEKK